MNKKIKKTKSLKKRYIDSKSIEDNENKKNY